MRLCSLALVGLVLATGASAQERWTYACADGLEAGRGVYYTVASDASADGCIWTTTTGTTIQAPRSEIDPYLRRLETITDWFRDNGFREPALEETDGMWTAVLFPSGEPACDGGSCTDVLGRPGLLQRRSGGDVLMIGSDALTSRDRPALIGLMLAVQHAYPTAFPGYGTCAPGCWIRYGTAYGFAEWWLWQTARERIDPKRRFGRPLVTGSALSEIAEGAYTSEFWVEVAHYISNHHQSPWEPMEGFRYVADLYEALDRGVEAVAAVEQVLGKEAYRVGAFNYGPNKVPSAFSMAFATFVAGRASRSPLAELAEPMHVPIGEAVRRRVSGHPPMAVVRIPVTVGRELSDVALSVRVEDATGSIAYNVTPPGSIGLYNQRIDPAQGRFNYGTTTEQLCPDTPGPCAFDVVVANAHPESASRSTPQAYTVIVEAHETCRLGDGVRGATYAVTGPDPQTGRRGTIARIDLDLPRSVRDRGANPIDGRVSIEAGPIPVATGFRARLACDGGGFRLTDVTFSNPMLSRVAGPLSGSLRGPSLSFPPTLEVGDDLPDVISRASFAIGSETATTSRGRLYGLRVTDHAVRDIDGLGPVDVWRIEGRSRSEMQMDGRGTVAALDDAGADVEGDVERPVQDAMRDAGLGPIPQRRAAAEQAVDPLAGDDDQPVVIWYSPAYGAVETTTGEGAEAVTSRLVELRIEPELD